MTLAGVAAEDHVENEQIDRSQPLVSVILPTYNRASKIRRAIDSVLQQSYENLELIVVDDGSADESISLVETIKDDRLRLFVFSENRGANAARNFGIAKSNGQYICFQDSDDIWHENKLQRQVDDIVSSQSRVAFCALERVTDNRRQIIPKPGYRIPSGKTDLSKLILKGSFIGCPALIIERSLILDVGGFDESLRRLQDWELMIRLCHAAEVFFSPSVLVTAKIGGDSISQDEAALIQSLEHIHNKHALRFGHDSIASGIFFLSLAMNSIRQIQLFRGIGFVYKSLATTKFDFGVMVLFLLRRR